MTEYTTIRKEISEEIELTLGLSLNGKFGADPIRTKNDKLKRTCSAISTTRFEFDTGPWLGGEEAIARTSSMPVNTEEEEEEEEEETRRKEFQMLRRRQAKRRLSEKLRSFGVGGGGSGSGDYEKTVAVEVEEEREDSLQIMVSQRSTGSSGLSEVESQTMPLHHGTNSPQSVQSFSEQIELRRETANRDAKPQRSISAPNGMVKNVLADMPCVSTKGDGPNGKKVDGFLYRYKKGEEVRIVCVCHGSFLSPAEFVKHAGGGDVEHPSRHIFVNPSPSL